MPCCRCKQRLMDDTRENVDEIGAYKVGSNFNVSKMRIGLQAYQHLISQKISQSDTLNLHFNKMGFGMRRKVREEK